MENLLALGGVTQEAQEVLKVIWFFSESNRGSHGFGVSWNNGAVSKSQGFGHALPNSIGFSSGFGEPFGYNTGRSKGFGDPINGGFRSEGFGSPYNNGSGGSNGKA